LSIFQGDMTILTAIELGIEDMRKNEWLVDDMLSDLRANVYLRQKFGQKQIDACKEWFRNTGIDVYMRPRDDKDRLPCVTIEMGSSNEKPEMKHLADLSAHKKILLPNEIDKPIPYVVRPFIPTDYDQQTGLLGVPDTVNLVNVAPGMVLVDPAKGIGYIIQGIGDGGILLEPNQSIDATQLGILPQYQYYETRVEHAFFEETYAIRCHAHGDVQTTLWLWSIVKYAILRYKQSLLEAQGFAETVLTSGPPEANEEWTTPGGEKAFTRSLVITGQVEDTWLKAPHRYVEVIAFQEKENCEYTGGIKIISNLDSPPFAAQSTQPWTTVVDSTTPPEEDDEDGDY
jgi:hypothetical protein